jgi:hypothetical protein
MKADNTLEEDFEGCSHPADGLGWTWAFATMGFSLPTNPVPRTAWATSGKPWNAGLNGAVGRHVFSRMQIDIAPAFRRLRAIIEIGSMIQNDQ